MEWPLYQQRCDQPDYWSAWMLEQCSQLLNQLQQPHLSQLLQAALQQSPLERPADHKGPSSTWMYQLNLSQADRQAVLRAISAAHRRGLSTSGTSGRGLGGFVEAWQEYANSTDC